MVQEKTKNASQVRSAGAKVWKGKRDKRTRNRGDKIENKEGKGIREQKGQGSRKN